MIELPRRHGIKPSIPIPCRIAREANNEHELMAIGILDVGVVKLRGLFLININASRKQLGLLRKLRRERLVSLGRLLPQERSPAPEAPAPPPELWTMRSLPRNAQRS